MFCETKDLHLECLASSCIDSMEWSDIGVCPEGYRPGQDCKEDQQLSLQLVVPPHTTDIVQRKDKDQYSLVPTFSQDLPEWS